MLGDDLFADNFILPILKKIAIVVSNWKFMGLNRTYDSNSWQANFPFDEIDLPVEKVDVHWVTTMPKFEHGVISLSLQKQFLESQEKYVGYFECFLSSSGLISQHWS